MGFRRTVCAAVLIATACPGAYAAGGFLGIDSRLQYDNQGIWKRSNQKALEAVMIGGSIAGALWEGSDTLIGKTFWQSVDASLIGGASYLVLNNTLRRERPSQTDSPNRWLKPGGHSFPSGEVTAISSIVTPFVLEYGHDFPWAYALELLPAYDAEARMKTQGHWQTDVLAGWALGTAAGYLAHSLAQPLTVSVLPRGLTIGWHRQF